MENPHKAICRPVFERNATVSWRRKAQGPARCPQRAPGAVAPSGPSGPARPGLEDGPGVPGVPARRPQRLRGPNASLRPRG